MAGRLLLEAGRNRKVSTRQLEHLKSLFGPQTSKEWYKNKTKG